MDAVSVQEVSFAYGTNAKVLEIASFGASRGERLFIHGPSGSGKTTFLGLLTGILSPQSGRVSILGQNISELSPRQKDGFRSQHIGYIFQQFNLIPYLSVIDNILLPLWMNKNRMKKIQSKKPAEEAEALAERLGLIECIKKNVLELSVGQQQRVAVARALIGQPDLIIADEPTSALDEDRQKEFIDLLLEKTESRKSTILFVSHNQRLAAHFDRSISLGEMNTAKGLK